MGHKVVEGGSQGAAEVIILNAKENLLKGAVDRRPAVSEAAGK
ncbi:hypothetical protein [Undibacterium sp. Ji22W]